MQNFELSPWALLSPSAGEQIKWVKFSEEYILRIDWFFVLLLLIPAKWSRIWSPDVNPQVTIQCFSRNWVNLRSILVEIEVTEETYAKRSKRSKDGKETSILFFRRNSSCYFQTSANSPGYGPRMSFYRWNFFFNCIETREPAILVDIEVTKETCEEKPPEQISKGNFGVLISTWSVKTLKFKTLKILEELSIAYLKWYFVLLPTPANGLEYSPRVSFYIWAQFLLHKKS